MENLLYCLDFENGTAQRLTKQEFCETALPCLTARQVVPLTAARERYELSQGQTPEDARFNAVCHYAGHSYYGEITHFGCFATPDSREFAQAACNFSPALFSAAKKVLAAESEVSRPALDSLVPQKFQANAWAVSRQARQQDPEQKLRFTRPGPYFFTCNFQEGTFAWQSQLGYGEYGAEVAKQYGKEDVFWDAADFVERLQRNDPGRLPELLFHTANALLNPLIADKPSFPHHGIAPVLPGEALVLAQMLHTAAGKKLETQLCRDWNAINPESSLTVSEARQNALHSLFLPYERAAAFWNAIEHPKRDPELNQIPCIVLDLKAETCSACPQKPKTLASTQRLITARSLAAQPKVAAVQALTTGFSGSFFFAKTVSSFVQNSPAFAALGDPGTRGLFIQEITHHDAFIASVRRQRQQLLQPNTKDLTR